MLIWMFLLGIPPQVVLAEADPNKPRSYQPAWTTVDPRPATPEPTPTPPSTSPDPKAYTSNDASPQPSTPFSSLGDIGEINISSIMTPSLFSECQGYVSHKHALLFLDALHLYKQPFSCNAFVGALIT